MKRPYLRRRGNLYQVNGRGPWRGEYKTDCALRATLRPEHGRGPFPVLLSIVDDSGEHVAAWEQYTMGHRILPGSMPKKEATS